MCTLKSSDKDSNLRRFAMKIRIAENYNANRWKKCCEASAFHGYGEHVFDNANKFKSFCLAFQPARFYDAMSHCCFSRSLCTSAIAYMKYGTYGVQLITTAHLNECCSRNIRRLRLSYFNK